LFWNKSSSPTEVSKRAGLIAFVPHRGVSSFRRLSRKRHARQSDKNGKSTRSSRSSATSDGSVERALEATRGRPRRVSASRARAAASAVRSEVNSCYPIVRKPAKALVGLGRHALSSHRASEAAAAAPRREKRTRRASRSGAAASPVAGGGATRAPHVPHASRVGIRGDATIAGRSRRTRGAPRGGARAIL
jgi:hypothetical protein